MKEFQEVYYIKVYLFVKVVKMVNNWNPFLSKQ